MKMFIPTIGTRIQLTQDWTFTIICEYRNDNLGIMVGKARPDGYWADWGAGGGNGRKVSEWGEEKGTVTLPQGIILTCDRIYIRKGASGYDSVSFWLNSNPNLKFGGTEIPIAKKVRFFAKLHDVNGIEFEIAPEVVKKARKKMADKTAG